MKILKKEKGKNNRKDPTRELNSCGMDKKGRNRRKRSQTRVELVRDGGMDQGQKTPSQRATKSGPERFSSRGKEKPPRHILRFG